MGVEISSVTDGYQMVSFINFSILLIASTIWNFSFYNKNKDRKMQQILKVTVYLFCALHYASAVNGAYFEFD